MKQNIGQDYKPELLTNNHKDIYKMKTSSK
jgi:hypothetical protein